jgi:hypothetical protein
MKLKTTFFSFLFLSMVSACCKDSSINSDLIGTWTGTRTETIFENDVQTQTFTSIIQLTLSSNNQGKLNGFFGNDEVHWYSDKPNNKILISVFSQDSLTGTHFTDRLFDIKLDKSTEQIWEWVQTSILFPTTDKRKTVETWGIKKD